MMSELIDPIQFLRDTLSTHKDVILTEKKQLFFPEQKLKLPLDTATAWKKFNSSDYYNLGSLWFLGAHRELKPSEYMKLAGEQGMEVVHFQDRKEVVDFFTGTLASSNKIDEAQKAHTLINKALLRSRKVKNIKEIQKKREDKLEDKIREREAKYLLIDHILRNERKIHSRATCIQTKNKSYLKVLELAYQMTGQPKKAEEVKKKMERRGTMVLDINLDGIYQGKKKQKSLYELIIKPGQEFSDKSRPIIIVPNTYQEGNICLFNSQSFLQKGRYLVLRPEQEMKAYDAKNVDVEVALFERSVGFEIIDTPGKLEPAQWKKVVAVFVSGTEWYFKDWHTYKGLEKWKELSENKRMIELFMRVRGYYLHYGDQFLPDFVKKFNIKVLNLNRHKRHQDMCLQKEFWEDLETFMKKEKTFDIGF